MGTTSHPLDRQQSRQLNKVAVATTDATGTATFLFDYPDAGTVWTGTLACPAATPTAQFVGSIALQPWIQWTGSATAGPVQIFPMQQFTVVGTSLAPNAQYTVVLIGSLDPQTSPPAGVWPDPTSSSSITLAGSQTIVNTAATLPGGFASGSNNRFNMPLAARTLLVYMVCPGGTILNVTMTGTTPISAVNGFLPLYNAIPYIQTVQGALAVVPVEVNLTQFNLQVTTSTAGNYGLTIYADSQGYTEAQFYNGIPAAATTTTAGTVTLVTGPCRLLTSDISTGAGGVASLSLGGIIVASSTSGGSSQHDFPQPYLVDPGVTLVSTITAPARVAVSTAFP